MKIHSWLPLFVVIPLLMAFQALILACGGEEPDGSTPATPTADTEETGEPAASANGGTTHVGQWTSTNRATGYVGRWVSTNRGSRKH